LFHSSLSKLELLDLFEPPACEGLKESKLELLDLFEPPACKGLKEIHNFN